VIVIAQIVPPYSISCHNTDVGWSEVIILCHHFMYFRLAHCEATTQNQCHVDVMNIWLNHILPKYSQTVKKQENIHVFDIHTLNCVKYYSNNSNKTIKLNIN
jgi:hypothetical protein